MADVVVDLDGLKDVAVALREAGTALDGTGVQAPAAGDYGAAGAAVALALAAHTEAAALLSAECAVLARAVGLCATDMAVTDAGQAVAMLTVDLG